MTNSTVLPNVPDTTVISSSRTVDTLLGKVLVCKRSHHTWSSTLGGNSWDVKAGTFVCVLLEGSAKGWREQKTAKFLYNGVAGEIVLDHDFDNNWGIISPDDRLKGKWFVFTGALSNTRDYYKSLVEMFGGNFGTSVTAATSYLVVGDPKYQGDPNHESTKAKKARSLGVPVIGESKFFKLVETGL
jgi:NAD-dependent DNA ligase